MSVIEVPATDWVVQNVVDSIASTTFTLLFKLRAYFKGILDNPLNIHEWLGDMQDEDPTVYAYLQQIWGPTYVSQLQTYHIITPKGKQLIADTTDAIEKHALILLRPSLKLITRKLETVSDETLSFMKDILVPAMDDLMAGFDYIKLTTVFNGLPPQIWGPTQRQYIKYMLGFRKFYQQDMVIIQHTRLEILRQVQQRQPKPSATEMQQQLEDTDMKRLKVEIEVLKDQSRQLKQLIYQFIDTLPNPSIVDSSYFGRKYTWRQLLKRLAARVTRKDVVEYGKQQDLMFINNDNDMDKYIPFTWINVLRQIIRMEYESRVLKSEEDWAKFAQQIRNSLIEETWSQESPFSQVMQVFNHTQSPDPEILRKLLQYARKRYQSLRLPERRTGRYGVLSAQRDLYYQRVRALIIYLFDLGDYVYGQDIGLPRRVVGAVDRIVDPKGKYTSQATRIIQSPLLE